MKQNELRKCCKCGKGVMHSGVPIFFRVRIERMAVNLPAVQRQHGLEQMLGGHAVLANVMGPNEDLAVNLGDPVTAIVCMDCSIRGTVVEIEELAGEKDQDISCV